MYHLVAFPGIALLLEYAPNYFDLLTSPEGETKQALLWVQKKCSLKNVDGVHPTAEIVLLRKNRRRRARRFGRWY